MTRPTSVKPDNFFLLLFRALRQRRVPIALRLASHSLILVALALLIYAWVMGMQFRQAMQQQADALGQSLITQTAASATELLVSNDILSLNVLLNNLVKNPLVAHAAIYSVDQRILAEAGSRPKQSLLGATEGLYSTPITFQEVIAGHLRISLDMQQFQQPMMISLQSMGLISLILLILALYFSLRLGRQISTPLLQLRVWLRDPDNPAPGAELQNELGDLARDLEERLVPEKPPAPEPEEAPLPQNFDDILLEDDEADLRSRKVEASAFEEDDIPLGDALLDETKPVEFTSIDEDPLDQDAFDENGAEAGEQPAAREPQHSAVLAIQLGAQEQLRRLPRSRLVDLLQRYRDCLEQAARQYKGSLHTLSDGGSLILFHSRDNRADYLTNALCCGELMRALGHALQIEVADSGITLQLQLGLSLGEDLSEQTQADLLLNETVQNALALNQHSRNLLLVERSIADDAVVRERARIRAIASPEGACCVERLLEPYPSMLERQLARMHDRARRDHPDHPPAAGPGGGTGPWQPGDPATPAAGRHARRLPAGLRRSRLQARHRLSRCLRPSRLQPFAIVRRDPRRARRPRLPAAA
ncbi:HAMP domain-containing protein [Pseudomonas aeruginosa]|nr:HAMP domain-containing protein [Pseudomonas aeruginosa]